MPPRFSPPPVPDRSAFTLVELLVVLAVIALLASLRVPALAKTQQSSKDIQCLSQITPAGGSAPGIALNWTAVSGRSYQIQFTDDLSAPRWDLWQGTAPAVGNQGSASLMATNSIRFFRLRWSE